MKSATSRTYEMPQHADVAVDTHGWRRPAGPAAQCAAVNAMAVLEKHWPDASSKALDTLRTQARVPQSHATNHQPQCILAVPYHTIPYHTAVQPLVLRREYQQNLLIAALHNSTPPAFNPTGLRHANTLPARSCPSELMDATHTHTQSTHKWSG